MVVLVILGILTGLVAGALRGAQQDTLAAKTRGTIAKIDAILNERIDEYLTKQLKYSSDAYLDGNLFPTAPGSAVFTQRESFPVENIRRRPLAQRLEDTNWNPVPGRAAPPFAAVQVPPAGFLRERVRLAATRDLMRMEMPDCVGDIFAASYARPMATTPLPGFPGSILTNPVAIATGFREGPLTSPPAALTRTIMRLETPHAFQRIVQRVWQADQRLEALNRSSPITGAEERWSDTFSNEELLYMIIDESYVDGSPAIEAFAASEIGDLDDDSLKEFIDAWGNPIRWIRWPAGVDSVAPISVDPLMPGALSADPLDPTFADLGFDLANTGLANAAPGNGLRPLVVSAGQNGRFGIRFYAIDPASVASSPLTSPIFSPSNVGLTGGSTPKRPGYWTTNPFNWPDPFWPRAFPIARRGVVLNSTIDVVHDPVGVNLNMPSPPSFIAHPDANANYFIHSQDNVTNLDESGAAP